MRTRFLLTLLPAACAALAILLGPGAFCPAAEAAVVDRSSPITATDPVSIPILYEPRGASVSPASMGADPVNPDTDLTWESETVVDSHWFQSMGSQYMRLDNAGYPRMAYGRNRLFYAWHDGAIWRTETVDGADRVGGGDSLALDSHGAAHIDRCSPVRARHFDQ